MPMATMPKRTNGSSFEREDETAILPTVPGWTTPEGCAIASREISGDASPLAALLEPQRDASSRVETCRWHWGQSQKRPVDALSDMALHADEIWPRVYAFGASDLRAVNLWSIWSRTLPDLFAFGPEERFGESAGDVKKPRSALTHLRPGDGGSGWESNPPLPGLAGSRTALKAARVTRPESLPGSVYRRGREKPRGAGRGCAQILQADDRQRTAFRMTGTGDGLRIPRT